MKRFDKNFKTKLYETIQGIENNSLVEVVAIIKERSGEYRDVSLMIAAVVTFVAYTFFMFAPIDFNVYLIYFMTIFSFFIGYLVVEFFNPLSQIFVKQARKNKNVEIYSRAVFQKGGIRFTNEKIGVLFFVSLFEKSVKIVADRGAETAVPAEDWEKIQAGFDTIFSSSDISAAFIEQLNNCKAIFAEYIPPIENDINELPDDLAVNF